MTARFFRQLVPLAMILVGALTLNAAPLDIWEAQERERTLRQEIMGFYVGEEPGIPSSFASMYTNRDLITSVAPFWYRLDSRDPARLEICGGVAPREMDMVMDFARRNNIRVYALVHNILYGKSSTGKNLVRTALSNPDKRRQLVDSIAELLKTRGFDGVCMDIENIYPGDRNLYLGFLSELCQRLKPAGYAVIVCVPAKTSDLSGGGWGDNFDYAVIGRLADRVVIMAYDEHNAVSTSGPIASFNWVEQVVNYALTRIPPEKILLGIPGYGFDWNLDRQTSRYLSYRMAVQTAGQYGTNIERHPRDRVPYYNYRDENGLRHSVYFEDAVSMAAKLELAGNLNLAGIALWRLGMEDPAGWAEIPRRLR